MSSSYTSQDADDDVISITRDVDDFYDAWLSVTASPFPSSSSTHDNDSDQRQQRLVKYLHDLKFLTFAADIFAITSTTSAGGCVKGKKGNNYSPEKKTLGMGMAAGTVREVGVVSVGILTSSSHSQATCTSRQPSLLLLAAHLMPTDISVEQLVAGPDAFMLLESEDISTKQLGKDFDRERVVINGTRLNGARVGLAGICDHLELCIDLQLAHCGLSGLAPSLRAPETKKKVALSVLRQVSRTNCGSLSFAAVRHFVAGVEAAAAAAETSTSSLSSITILPLSTAGSNRSLQIKTKIGAVASTAATSTGSWCLQFVLKTSTWFQLSENTNTPPPLVLAGPGPRPGGGDHSHSRVIEDSFGSVVLEVVYRNTVVVTVTAACGEANGSGAANETLSFSGLDKGSGTIHLVANSV